MAAKVMYFGGVDLKKEYRNRASNSICEEKGHHRPTKQVQTLSRITPPLQAERKSWSNQEKI